jgi:hypothetical protein
MPKTPLDELTPEQRFQQIAAILAKGVTRCKRHLAIQTQVPSQTPSNSSRLGLEVRGEPRLSVSRVGG